MDPSNHKNLEKNDANKRLKTERFLSSIFIDFGCQLGSMWALIFLIPLDLFFDVAPKRHPRPAQEGPRASKSAPRVPKSAPKAPETCPGECPRAPEERPRAAQSAPRAPKTHKNAEKHANEQKKHLIDYKTKVFSLERNELSARFKGMDG